MKPIAIDWERRPGRSRLGWLLLAAGLIAALWAVERHRGWLHQVEQIEARSSQLRQSVRRAAVRVREPAREQTALLQEVRAANRVLEQLGVPWPELFRDLEAAVDPTVALLAIQPDGSARTLRLEGEARDFRAVLAFVRRLEGTGAFHGVHVTSHQVRVGAPVRAVGFALVAGWGSDPR